MRVKVKLKKGQLDHFRKLARNTHKEIQAYLIGEVVSPEVTVVHKFVYCTKYAVQTPSHVQWFNEEYEKVKKSAEERGLRVVGDIHSHPKWDAVMSPSDYKAHIEEGHRVSGICSTESRKTRVRFWVAEFSLPCEIVYDKTSKT